MSDNELREAVKSMMAKAFGNSVMVELVDGKFLVHLKVKDPETRPLLEEMAGRCLDCVHDMRMIGRDEPFKQSGTVTRL